MADSTVQNIDVTPDIVNIECQQGTDLAIEFGLTNSLGEAEDISGDSVLFTARDGYYGTVMITTKTNGPSDHSAPAEGRTVFVLTKANLTPLVPEDRLSEVGWKYEVRRVFSGTNREIIYIQGDLRLMPSVWSV